MGYDASHLLDNGIIKKIEAARDQARDCRLSGSALHPCPVEYRNTRIVWQTKVETKTTPDPRQAERIRALSANLADAQHTIRDLEGRLAFQRTTPSAFNYYLQNGSMAHPYNSADHCPAGAGSGDAPGPQEHADAVGRDQRAGDGEGAEAG